MHMISRKDLSDAEMDTLTKSRSPTTVITANGEVQTHEEATVYVKELDIFSVLSLGKLCDENGILMNGSTVKNHISLNGIRIRELRSYRGSRLVNEFFLRFSSFNFKDTFKTGESLFYIFFKLVFVTGSNIK